MNHFSTLDIVIFVAALLGVMFAGIWVGRKEKDSADFFLASRGAPWWAVAGSIFGSNISAHHIVGMMGVGFSVGFAQSHFEISSVFGLLLLTYGFLPVYRKLNIYTLSEYLQKRYSGQARLIYALIMLIIMVVIQMVPGFYIGSRAMITLFQEGSIHIAYNHYVLGIIVMAAIAGVYTILGGLKAVIVTDVIQSALLILGGIAVAFLTFSQPEINGWSGMLELDQAGKNMMHIYLPSDHPQLPWTGALSGLIILHFYYWGTNQFIVQRTLAAKSGKQARLGIIASGFTKLLIPFMSVGTGVAAYYLLAQRGIPADQDVTFPLLLKYVVAPVGFGLVGLIAASMIGAILSSVDSWLNSSATIITFDFYQKYVNPDASEKKLVFIGRLFIAICLILAMTITIFTMDPNATDSFFLNIADQSSKLVIGLVVAFSLGMFWKRATAAGGVAAIVSGIFYAYLLTFLYDHYLYQIPALNERLGDQLNFMHNAFITAVLSTATSVVVSLCTRKDPEKSKYTWTELGGHKPGKLKMVAKAVLVVIAAIVVFAMLMVKGILSSDVAGLGPAMLILFIFAKYIQQDSDTRFFSFSTLNNDVFWAGILSSVTVFMMFHFY